MTTSVAEIARRLHRLERAMRRSHTPQLANSSIENGAVESYYDDQLGLIIGEQYDGTQAVAVVNSPPPPQPSGASATAVLQGLKIRWDGTFADGSVAPMNFGRVEVHVSKDPAFTAEYAETLVGTFETPRGGELFVSLFSDGDYYVRLVARNQAGGRSDASVVAGPFTPEPLPDVQAGTDGDPPMVAPVVTPRIGLGSIHLAWTGVENPDPVWYDVAASTSEAFSDANILGQTPATLLTVSTLADGTDIATDAPTYFRVRAVDADGPGPWSAVVSQTPRAPISEDDLATSQQAAEAARDAALAAQSEADTAQQAAEAARADADAAALAASSAATDASGSATAASDAAAAASGSASSASTAAQEAADAEARAQAAEAAAVAAEQRAVDAEAAAVQAALDAEQAAQSASGGNVVWYSETEPVATERTAVEGDTWYKLDAPLPGGNIIGVYTWDPAANSGAGGWVPQQFTHETIASLDLGKATVGELDASFLVAGSIGSREIASDYAYLGNVSADQITSGLIEAEVTVAGTLATALEGQRVVMDSEGFRMLDANGDALVDMPNNPGARASFRGDAYINHLTVESLTTLTESELAQSATFTLNTSPQPPGQPPQISAMYAPWFGSWGNRNFSDHRGLAVDDMYGDIWTWNDREGRIERYTPNGSLYGTYNFNTSTKNGYAQVAITTSPGQKLWVMAWHRGVDAWIIERYSITAHASTINRDREWYWNHDSNTWAFFRRPALGWDYATNRLIVAKARSSDNRMRFYEHSYANAAELTYHGVVTGQADYAVQPAGVVKGDFGWGIGQCYVIGNEPKTTDWEVFRASDGVLMDDHSWPSGQSAGKVGIYWDGVQFKSLDKTGRTFNYEEGNSWVGAPYRDWTFAYTWAENVAGGAETTRSPMAVFNVPKKARLKISTPPMPATGGIEMARIYADNSDVTANEDLLGILSYQGDAHPPDMSLTINYLGIGGEPDPLSNTFLSDPSDVPAAIHSQGKRPSGKSRFEVDGSGAGRFDGLLPPGAIIMYGGPASKPGWEVCDGRLLNRHNAAYMDLFAEIGYTHGGSGDFFALPNLTDRMPVGAGTVGLGAVAGSWTADINQEHVPPHMHDMTHDHPNATGGDHIHSWISESSNENGIRNQTKRDGNGPGSAGFTTASADGGHSHNVITSGKTLTGDGSEFLGQTPLPVDNPRLGLLFLIKL